MLNVLLLPLLFFVLDGFLVDHVVEEEEVDPCSDLTKNFDQLEIGSLLHDGELLAFSS